MATPILIISYETFRLHEVLHRGRVGLIICDEVLPCVTFHFHLIVLEIHREHQDGCSGATWTMREMH